MTVANDRNMYLTQIAASLDMTLGGPSAVVLNTHALFSEKISNCNLLVFGNTHLKSKKVMQASTLFDNRFALLVNMFNISFIKTLRQSEVIIVHGYYLFSTMFSAIFYPGKRFFLMPHGTFEYYQQKRHRFRKIIFTFFLNIFLKNRKIHFLVASESEIQPLKAKFPNSPITVVGLGIKLPKLALENYEMGKVVRLIFLGRIAEKKRIDLCLYAVKKLKMEGHSILFDIVGTGNDQLIKSLKKLVGELKIEDSVNFLGHLENEELANVLSRCDIFMLPSENENFAIAVAESIGASIPVIISKNVAMHHFVDKYRVGITIESLDSNLLSKAVLNLADNYAFYKDNCIRYRELLDWSTVFIEWEKIIFSDNELVI